jgi:hypothetical protein
MTVLDTAETLARIRDALPRGHRLLDLLGTPDSGASGFRPVFPGGIDAAAHAWRGEIGVFACPGGNAGPRNVALLVWLGRRTVAAEPGGAAGLQFILDLPAARYRIEYWKAGEGLLEGVEIGTGPRLVLSPPGEAPLVALVAVLP